MAGGRICTCMPSSWYPSGARCSATPRGCARKPSANKISSQRPGGGVPPQDYEKSDVVAESWPDACHPGEALALDLIFTAMYEDAIVSRRTRTPSPSPVLFCGRGGSRHPVVSSHISPTFYVQAVLLAVRDVEVPCEDAHTTATCRFVLAAHSFQLVLPLT